jgi:hypothetical protein
MVYPSKTMNVSTPMGRRILGGGLIAFGVFGGLGVLLFWSFGVFNSLLRVDAPGSSQAEFHPGSYAIYWESPLLAGRRSRPPYVRVEIEAEAGGAAVPVSTDLFLPLRYSTLDQHYGALIAEFTIDRQAQYRILVGEPNVKQAVPGQVSIARGLTIPALIRLCAVPFTTFWGGVGSGLYILLKRRKPA